MREFPLEFCNRGIALQKPVMLLPDDGKSLTIYAIVSIQYHQSMTGRQKDRFATKRDKNWSQFSIKNLKAARA